MEIKDNLAIVTGASTGIGRALAIELAKNGARILITARSLERLAQTSALLDAYGASHESAALDVTSEASMDAFVRMLEARKEPVGILVNNAGVGLFEDILKSSSNDMQAVFATNFWGPLTLLQRIVPRMHGGTVVTISSAAAKYAPYQQGIYAASKAAIERVTEALSVEASNVHSLLVIPDRTDTPFMRNVVGPREKAKLALQLKFASPELVAKKIVRAIRNDSRICYPTLKSYVYTILSSGAPWLVRKIVARSAV